MQTELLPSILRILSQLHSTMSNNTPRTAIRLGLMSMGALLNLQMDTDIVKQEMRASDVVNIVVAVLDSSPFVESAEWGMECHIMGWQTAEWAFRLIEDLLSDTEAIRWTPESASGLFQPILHLQQAVDTNIHDDIVEYQISMTESIASILDHESKNPSFCLALLPDFGSAPFHTLLTLNQELFMPSIWHSISNDQTSSLATEAQEALGHLKKAMTHAIIATASEDANVNKICPLDGNKLMEPHPYLNILRSWLSDQNEDTMRSVCTILTIGNLARDHVRSLALVDDFRIHDLIVNKVQNHPDDVHIIHAAISALSNMAIPDKNKYLVASSGIISLVLAYLDPPYDFQKQVQLGLTNLLKNIASSVQYPDITLSLLGTLPSSSTCATQKLQDLWERTDDQTLRMRIARVFIMLIRSMFSSSTGNAGTERIVSLYSLLPEQVDSMYTTARAKLAHPTVINALCHLACCSREQPVLMSEALLGLALLGQSSSKYAWLTPRHTGCSTCNQNLVGPRRIPFDASLGDGIRHGQNAYPNWNECLYAVDDRGTMHEIHRGLGPCGDRAIRGTFWSTHITSTVTTVISQERAHVPPLLRERQTGRLHCINQNSFIILSVPN